jgi:hypothetical protein
MTSYRFLLSTVTLCALAAHASGAERLPALNADIKQSSVSGLSSGAFMAVQFHVSFSSTIVGAGIVAGGPYYCTRGSTWLLRYRIRQCMSPYFWMPAPNATLLYEYAEGFAAIGAIDDLSNLGEDRVYVFTGGNDDTVDTSVVDQTRYFYELTGMPKANIKYVVRAQAAHALITEDYGRACEVSKPPYIADCDYDQAGAILNHIYGKLEMARAWETHGRIVTFRQTEFMLSPTSSMADKGYAYVPTPCVERAGCRIHVVFHGCEQSAAAVGDVVYTKAGYNEWSAANDIIVLYPQVAASALNPHGCWDWWGYTGPEYATKEGSQIAAGMAMLRRLAGLH